ncbi:MAG: spore germination protein GerW family protein [Candidatus Cloacimonetes bacterium]|nr:spore germination protein GerW family protein [Candidatus Cloacimonadota bacterium]
MDFTQIISQIRSLVSKAGGVEMSFGQPTKVNDLHIIAVARTSFGFGAGGGSSPLKGKKNTDKKQPPVDESQQEKPNPPATDTDANMGGGGGGGMRTDPIGIYTIKGDVVKFHPVIGVKEMLALIAIVSVFTLRLMKQKRKGK